MTTNPHFRGVPVDYLQNRLYSCEFKFNGFKDITDERIKELKNDIKELLKNKKYVYQLNPKSARYRDILKLLVNNSTYTFDEKIAILIIECDPNYVILDNYLNAKLKTTDSEIFDDIDTQEEIKAYNLEISDEIGKIVRQEIGFYDYRLAAYEKIYKNKKEKVELEFGINKDYIDNLFSNIDFTKYDHISDDRLEEIKEEAQEYRKTYTDASLNDLCYQLVSQGKAFKLNNRLEKIIFAIYAFDINLFSLETYYQYCNWEDVKERCIYRLGYFSKSLIEAEAQYDDLYNEKNKRLFWDK